ncbi:peptide chain release factor 2 [Thiohalospira sp.]|uniref:peptide chain release factor 2 n=1 Tax=Thiohalospira sp. TaxID=3080549 RepID=UPI003980467F
MQELNAVYSRIRDLQGRAESLRGYLDLDGKRERLTEVDRELEDPAVWSTPDKAQELGRERARLAGVISEMDAIQGTLEDAGELLEMAAAEEDQETVDQVIADLDERERQLERLEFQRMFSGDMDSHNAYLDIQSGSGGTEAQDWAEMLLRMYLRWAERRGFDTEIIEVSEGDVTGLKSASVKITGDYAYGWLRTETGVHRLVRKSPFDSGNRRHTSFASVFVYPEVDDTIEIEEPDPGELRVDTYRAAGAGGQHVNKTDSAVRLTHLPTGIVVQCQTERSQHQNKARAMESLKAKLYEMEKRRQDEERLAQEESKSDIGWGSQIRSYVLDSGRIKDLRTGVEVGNTQAVLDGDLDGFIQASLKQGL